MPEFRDLLLVAITGWGQEEDRRRALAAGFDAHLTKPADPAAVAALLAHGAAVPRARFRGWLTAYSVSDRTAR